jgi:hypothetical protein
MRTTASCALALLFAAAVSNACNQMMNNEPRYNPLASSDFFDDGMSARAQVPDTVTRGHLRIDRAFYTGIANGQPVDTIPLTVTIGVLARGRERYDIFCTPCHGRVGDGDGMIVDRGFSRPPSYHTDRLRSAPVGHFFDVMTNGFGAMSGYAARVPPEDRWAIAAYIRALQLSQQASVADAPPGEQRRLMEAR